MYISFVYSIFDSQGADAIEQAGKWEVNNVIGWDVANIEQELKNLGVPYAENCAEYNEGEDSLLCMIGYRVVDSEDYTQIENYLSIGTNVRTVQDSSPQWAPSETEEYHTGEELVEAARDYYTSVHGVEPPYVEIDTDSGDCVTIHLFDVVDGHTNTYDWYLVNRYSGEGNDFAGEFIDILE